MAAPAPTVRQTPAGIKLKDGFPTKITIGLDPDISFWEKSVKPPGADGGDEIDQTTMHNVDVTTKAPQSLIDFTVCSGVAAYDPNILNQILATINMETTITLTFSDGSTWSFYGYLKIFDPQELTRGVQPEANFEIVVTNWDPTNKVEAVPAVASVSGT